MDHSECVRASLGDPRAHVHEGEPGLWLFPAEVGQGLYDESPTGA